MKNPLTVLCIEDNDVHFADLQQMLTTELPRQPIKVNVLYARTLAEAESLFDQADAVMTDVFFPATTGSQEEPNGKVIVERCLTEKKPVVWVTSTYHHGRKTNSINEWGRDHGLEMFDCYQEGASNSNDLEGQSKRWKDAMFGLLYTVMALEMGKATFEDGSIVRNDGTGDGLKHDINHFFYARATKQDISSEPVLTKMKEMGFPLD